ncbi:prostaglandin F2 receptor negative regulator [Pangasianodon hypophthalmus]|uniref:prostaglandin F2 receptor negative regulator n=1 Tax=Pangasianodon hypophthalmus TaxID=310915 RepID=UPI0023077BF1|nr:prostaglandin F2 receptor negative regulator [Pangasianodon hypophthalmus]
MRKEKGAFCLFVLFMALAVLCESRVVKVPAGPLVRVEGQSVSIRCDVSDYEGPPEQDFDWNLIPDGETSVPLISTFEPLYTDPSMMDRIRSGDISVKKLADDAAELTIRKVRASDSTIYRCSTPSTDSSVKGNYYADVELKVIGDSLKVAPAISQPTVSEGESVKLLCNISRAYTAHTSLSVTWSVRKGATSLEELLTFGPDGMNVGQAFAQRYADGELTLVLPGGGSYGLIMKGVKPEDKGVYVCTGREWTRQPGGGKGWQNILERSEEMGNVSVTPLAQSLVVSLEKNVTLNVDDTLNLTCSVAANGLLSLGMEVVWLVKGLSGSDNQQVLLHVGRDGQVLTGSELVGMSRVQPGTFRLLLPKVQPSDSGLYSCQVKCWLPQGSGGWYQAAEKTSDSIQVRVTQLEPDFKVGLTAPRIPQFTDDPTELLCEVTNLLNIQDGRLSVTWSYANVPEDTSRPITTIASIDHHGVLVPGDLYRQRLGNGNIAVTRSGLSTFRLQLLHTQDKDMGFYSCSVAAWTRGHQGEWNKAKELKSIPVEVQWSSKTPVLSVAAKQVRGASTGGSTFEMSCQVTGQNIQNPGYSVLIRFEDTAGGKSRKVLSLSADSILHLEEGMVPSRADSVTLEKMGPLEYHFRLHGAQVSDRGFYYCDVTAWTRDQSNTWNSGVSAESNKIQLDFADTGPVFNVSIYSDSSQVTPGDTVKMECIMSVQGATSNTGEVAYDVQWFQSPAQTMENGAVPLISMDHWGVVKKSGGNESTLCSIERTDRDTFVLRVYHVQDRDMGEYYCTAKLWHFSPDTRLWSEGQKLTSAPVFLSISLALWDSMKNPVLYGLGAALVAALLSIVLGLITSRCCFSRNPMHTPRSKLMDLEMD